MTQPALRMAWVAALVLCGCSKDPNQPALVPMSGKVTLDNQPLAGAQVRFTPVGTTKGNGSTGRTDGDGVYQLTAVHGGTGAVPGEYRVVISKRLMPDGSDLPADSKLPPIESPAREVLGPEYSDPEQSRLTATVPAEGGTKDFHLKSTKKPR
jgi:hypothetical protein